MENNLIRVFAVFSLSYNCPAFYNYYYNQSCRWNRVGQLLHKRGPQVERLSVMRVQMEEFHTFDSLSHCEQK